MQVNYNDLKTDQFFEYIGTEMEKILGYFIAEASRKYRRTTYLRCELSDINNTLESLKKLLI